MTLYSSTRNNVRARFMGASTVFVVRDSNAVSQTMLAASFGGMDKRSSLPHGLDSRSALLMARTTGGLAAYLRGTSSLTAAIGGIAVMNATLNGTGTVTANDNMGRFISAQLSGVGSVTAAMGGVGNLSALISIGARPSATDIAEATLNGVLVEGGLTLRDVTRLLLAVAAGKTSIVDLGGGAATVTFRDVADTTDRVVADMTGSERTTVTRDPD